MRILLADDHEIIRRGIRCLLASKPDYEICGEAIDGLDAVKKAQELQPDLIIMDVSMPGVNGLEATRTIRSTVPQCEVVILTQHDSSQMIQKVFQAGARGYVVKTSIARDLLKTVTQVARHKSPVDPALADTGQADRLDLNEILQRAEAWQQELRRSRNGFRVMDTFGDISDHEQAELLLRETQQQLERIVQERTAALEERLARLAHQNMLLELANDAILFRDTGHKISYWSKGAERLYGWSSEEALGRTAQELLLTEFPIPLEEILSKDYWDGELRQTKRNGTSITVASRWVAMRDNRGNLNGWLVVNTDITARKQAEDISKNLSGRLLRLQDEERRRIARDLHDSAGQYLAGIKMALDSMRVDVAAVPPAFAHKVEEAAGLTEACALEIRTMSHLLHPPLLEELGLASAVRCYVDEFAVRSGIRTSLELPDKLIRLGDEIELVLFRVLQECLTNVHRHSGSKTADVRIGAEQNQVWIEVKDQGNSRKTSDPLRPGMGITGMRERVENLAGVLIFTSDHTGTLVRAVVPLSSEPHRRSRGARPKAADIKVAAAKPKKGSATDAAGN